MLKPLTIAFAAALVPHTSAACSSSFSDERSFVYCTLDSLAGKTTTLKNAQAVTQNLKRIGLGESSNQEIRPELSFFPIFRYDPNVNNGNPKKDLVINGLSFQGDPNFEKKDDLLLGLGVNLSTKMHLRDGTFVSPTVSISKSKGASTGLTHEFASAQVCLTNHAGNWIFYDACISETKEEKKLSSTQTSKQAIKRSKYSKVGNYFVTHTFGVAQREQSEKYIDISFSKSAWNSAGPGYELGLEINQNSTDQGQNGFQLNFSKVFANKPSLKFDVSYSEQDLPKFLSVNRLDKTMKVGLSFPIKSSYLSLGYRVVRSNIDYFDLDEPSLNVSFRF